MQKIINEGKKQDSPDKPGIGLEEQGGQIKRKGSTGNNKSVSINKSNVSVEQEALEFKGTNNTEKTK